MVQLLIKLAFRAVMFLSGVFFVGCLATVPDATSPKYSVNCIYNKCSCILCASHISCNIYYDTVIHRTFQYAVQCPSLSGSLLGCRVGVSGEKTLL